jgi:hypothetical protein
LEPGWLKKKRGKKKPGVTWLTRQVDPATRLTRQDPVANPLTFVFFLFYFFLLKRRRFDFFLKKRIDPANPVTQSKPGTRARS